MRLRGVCVEQVWNPVGTWCTCNKSHYGELFAACLTLQCIWAALMHKCSLLQSFWTSLSNDTPTRQILFVGCYSGRLHINTVGVAGNKLERIKPICFISFVVFIKALICCIILHLNNIKLNQMHPNVTENVRLIKTHPTIPSHHCTVIVCCQIYLYLNWKQRVQAPLWSLGIPGLWKCLACQESDINWECVWSENNSQ